LPLNPKLPREHGAWSALTVSLLAGTIIGGRVGANVPVLWLGAVAGFIGWENATASFDRTFSTEQRRRFVVWAALLTVLSLTCFGWLIFLRGVQGLIPLMIFTGCCVALARLVSGKRKSSSMLGEMLGMAGLSASSAMVLCASTGVLSSRVLSFWLVCFLFFEGPVFHVRFLVRRLPARRQGFPIRLRSGLPSVLYHCGMLALVGGLSFGWGLLPGAALWLLAPGALKAFWAVLRRASAHQAHREDRADPRRPLSPADAGHRRLVAVLGKSSAGDFP
jgi:hypothetical protein